MRKNFVYILLLLPMFESCSIFYEAIGNSVTVFESPNEVNNKPEHLFLDSASLAVTWIGHSSLLIQIDDKLILTDPIFTETIGIFSKRLVEPGVDIEKIPFLNLTLISHPHIDHLSLGSLEMIDEKFPQTHLVFPSGVENFLPDYSFQLHRLSNNNGYWNTNPFGDSVTADGIKVTAVTAHHWGGRYGLDGFLWGDASYTGYIIQYHDKCIYFGGDTGYDSTAFKTIGKGYNIDVAFIPIGPCADCKGCGNVRHVFPEGAIKIFLDLNAKLMIPIHYGVFQFRLTDVNEPLYAFKTLVQEYEITYKVKVLEIGEQVIINPIH